MTIKAMIRIIVDKTPDRSSMAYIPTLLRMFAKGLEDQGLQGAVYSEGGQLAEPMALSLIDIEPPALPDDGGSVIHIGPPVVQAQLEFHAMSIDPSEIVPPPTDDGAENKA